MQGDVDFFFRRSYKLPVEGDLIGGRISFLSERCDLSVNTDASRRNKFFAGTA
jgi:hypothetical protein